MINEQKDILLIGDTFVFNYHEKPEQDNEDELIKNTEEELAQKVGFEDSFVKALREEFNQKDLADTIESLLNQSTNPAVLHLSSILEQKGFSYDLVDCSLKHREKLLSLLKSTKYSVIGISTTFTVEISYIQKLIHLIKKYAPTAKILLGGMFIVKLFKLQKEEDVLQKILRSLNADYLIFNEIGEDQLIDVLNYEQSSKPDVGTIFNVAYKTESGYKINPYKRNDIDTSISNWTLSNNSTYAFIRASISCMFRCKFCDFPVIADKYKSKSIDIIRQEFEKIKEAGIKYVRFLDDTCNLPREHFHNILRELTSKDYGFEWVAYIRCQYLDDEITHLMKESGCIGVFLGIESGNNEMLKNMNKCVKVEEYERGIALLHKYDIPAYGAFVVGFPGETDETIQDTIRFIKQSKLKYFRLFSWAYGELTPIAKEKEKYGIRVYEDKLSYTSEWEHLTMTSKEALEKCKLIMKEVDTSIHCTVPYDFAFYLNRQDETKDIFNECLKLYNKRNLAQK